MTPTERRRRRRVIRAAVLEARLRALDAGRPSADAGIARPRARGPAGADQPAHQGSARD